MSFEVPLPRHWPSTTLKWIWQASQTQEAGSDGRDANPIPRAPQAGVGRQQAISSSSVPVPRAAVDSSLAIPLGRQILAVSLGPTTLAQVHGGDASKELRKRFWRGRGGGASGATFDSDLAKRILSEA